MFSDLKAYLKYLLPVAFFWACSENIASNDPGSSEEMESREDTIKKEMDYADTVFKHLPENEFYTIEIDTFPAEREKVDVNFEGKPLLGEKFTTKKTFLSDSVHWQKLNPEKPKTVKENFEVMNWVLPEPILSQLEILPDNPLGMKALGVYEGLIDSQVRSVDMDSQKRLWIGSDGGLSIFDGQFLWNIESSDHFPFRNCWNVFIDSKDRVWITGRDENGKNGFFVLENEQIKLFPDVYAHGFEEDSAGNIWIETKSSGALKYLTDGTFEQYGNDQGVGGQVYHIASEGEQGLWICSDSGIFVMNETQTLSLINSGANYPITQPTRDSKGNVWFINSYALFCYDRSKNTMVRYNHEKFSVGLRSLTVDRNDIVWIGSWGNGLLRFEEGHLQQFSKEEGLPDAFVWSANMLDSTEILCLSGMSGLLMFDTDLFRNHGPVKNNWMEVTTDSEENFWGSEFLGPISKFTKDSAFTITDISGETPYHSKIQSTDDGGLWIGWGFVTQHDPELIYHHTDGTYRYKNNDSISESLRYLAMSGSFENALWGRDHSMNVVRLGEKNWIRYKILSGNIKLAKEYAHYVYPIVLDKNGDLWFKSSFGIGKLHDKTFIWYTDPNVPTVEITEYSKSSDGEILLLTEDHTLYTIRKGKYVKLKSWDIFPEEVRFYQFDEKKAIAFGRTSVYLAEDSSYTKLNEHNGINGINFYYAEIGEDSLMWVGNSDITIQYDLKSHRRNLTRPELRITGLLINHNYSDRENLEGEWAKGIEFDSFSKGGAFPKSLKMDHTYDRATFHFSATDWHCPNGMQYTYKLDGSSVDWTDLNEEPKAVFNNLSAGNYTFRVKALSANGIWSNEVTYHFVILPPWWKTIWAYLAYVLIILLLIWLLIRRREKKLRMRQQKLENIVEERTEELAHKHQQLEVSHREITDSINYAKRIQSAILPPLEMMKIYLRDFFVFYQPKDVVAGDFYWMEPTEDGIYIAAADCTGHGVPGAMVSVVCYNALNRSVREFSKKNPAEILNKTRELVIEEFDTGFEEIKDGMDISLVKYQRTKEGATLQFAGAHNPLWIIRKDADEIEQIRGDKQPIGVFESFRKFTNHIIKLNKGDTFFLFSDGFADQFGGDKGKKMKSANFKRLLLSIKTEEMEQQKQLLAGDFEVWRGPYEQLDDVCVIGVRI